MDRRVALTTLCSVDPHIDRDLKLAQDMTLRKLHQTDGCGDRHLWEIFAKKDVIFESFCFSKNIFSFGTKLIRDGSNVNVIINDVIKPSVIIHPKSIIGFISLKIKDKKAIIYAKSVKDMASKYRKQLTLCKKNLDKNKYIIF